jgi:hypothetical protein
VLLELWLELLLGVVPLLLLLLLPLWTTSEPGAKEEGP